jgi:RNA polymerase sigma factor (sigma-70 family)
LRSAQDRPSDGAAPSPEVAVLAGEQRRELMAAIDQLGDEDRRIITLRWFADLSEREMAAVLDVPGGTVKSRLSRAMERLRAVMAGSVDHG